ncbi:MAG: hypothetical protein NTW14_04310 [bacterium]|nr:hypothetical protein [bacterium]
MTEIELKKRIEAAILRFQDLPLYEAGMNLLAALGYQSNLQLRVSGFDEFKHNLDQAGKLNEDHAKVNDWQNVELLCQITGDTLNASGQGGLGFQTEYQPNEMQSYLFLAIELKGSEYTRTDLARITRAVNQVFAMPALLIFKHGKSITLSIIDRRPHKREDSKDVLEKVTLIKDISCALPHRAHVEILFDLSLPELYRKHGFSNFEQLHAAWGKTLNTSALNKSFFKELSNWYYWSLANVEFPPDAPKDSEETHSISVIRLLTRLIFSWFIREKRFIPDRLFNENEIQSLLCNEFTPEGTGTIYYKAILQNLFFATLNTEMDQRKWAANSNTMMVHSLYRYRELFRDPDHALEEFSSIPFLNGGLFECLDKDLGAGATPRYIRMDGFSRKSDNRLRIPDFLFGVASGQLT